MQNPSSIKAVIFDWGGVLIDAPGSELIRYCANALDVAPDVLKATLSLFKPDFQKGIIDEPDVWQNICSQLLVPIPHTKSLWGDAVRNTFHDKKEIFETILELKKQGFSIGFLSNTEKPAMDYFYEQKYNAYFDECVFSCKEQLLKPEPEIYHKILHKLNVEASEALFIDDKISNVRGAENIGIQTLLFKDTVSFLQDISDLLKKKPS